MAKELKDILQKIEGNHLEIEIEVLASAKEGVIAEPISAAMCTVCNDNSPPIPRYDLIKKYTERRFYSD